MTKDEFWEVASLGEYRTVYWKSESGSTGSETGIIVNSAWSTDSAVAVITNPDMPNFKMDIDYCFITDVT